MSPALPGPSVFPLPWHRQCCPVLSPSSCQTQHLADDRADGKQLLGGVSCLREGGIVVVAGGHWFVLVLEVSTWPGKRWELEKGALAEPMAWNPAPGWLQCNGRGMTQNWKPLLGDKRSPQGEASLGAGALGYVSAHAVPRDRTGA